MFTLIGRPKMKFRTAGAVEYYGIECVRGITLDGKRETLARIADVNLIDWPARPALRGCPWRPLPQSRSPISHPSAAPLPWLEKTAENCRRRPADGEEGSPSYGRPRQSGPSRGS